MSPRAGRPSVTYKKKTIFALTAGASSSISPKLCMLIENVLTILKGVNHFSIQRIVLLQGRKCCFLVTDALSKFNTVRLPWQPAGNKPLTTQYFLLTYYLLTYLLKWNPGNPVPATGYPVPKPVPTSNH